MIIAHDALLEPLALPLHTHCRATQITVPPPMQEVRKLAIKHTLSMTGHESLIIEHKPLPAAQKTHSPVSYFPLADVVCLLGWAVNVSVAAWVDVGGTLPPMCGVVYIA